jgi:hypothetical protein
MAYNLAYIRNRVLNDKLDDTDYDPDIVDNFLRDAQRKIYNSYQLPFMEESFVGTLPPGSNRFNFPDDAQIPHGLIITDPEDLTFRKILTDRYLAFRKFYELYPAAENNTPATPYQWTIYAGRIVFNCPTDKTYTMTMRYTQKAPVLKDDGDVPGIPEEFAELLILGGFYRVQRRNEDYDEAAATKQEYNEELNEMLYRLSPPQTGTPTTIHRPAMHRKSSGRS